MKYNIYINGYTVYNQKKQLLRTTHSEHTSQAVSVNCKQEYNVNKY